MVATTGRLYKITGLPTGTSIASDAPNMRSPNREHAEMTVIPRRTRVLFAFAFGIFYIGSAWQIGLAGPSDLYVDSTITTTSCSDYSVTQRRCGAGTERAFRTIAGAAAATAPGLTVLIRQGTYTEQLTPPVSGTAASPIVYRSFPGETVAITGTQGLLFTNRSYITIDGIRVTDVESWGQAYDSHHIVLQNVAFIRATSGGTRGGFKFVRSHDNRVLNSLIEDGNDNLMFIHADRNLVTGNTMKLARHNLWGILCGSYNVIRGNDFDNETQKLGQITDCAGSPSDAATSLNDTKRNLVEHNVFRRTGQASPDSPYAGIQYAAQSGIIRKNVFVGNTGPAIQMTWYSDEARYNTSNRVYHNVLYGGKHAGVDLDPSGGSEFSDNVFKNNILYKTVMTDYASELEGKPVQVLAPRTTGYAFIANNLLGTSPGQLYVVANASRNSVSSTQRTLAQWQSSFPQLFQGNVEVLPQFQNEATGDFRLASGSPLIDAGDFLARTTVAGSGTSLAVDDVLWFFDGFEVSGLDGDLIQIQGQTDTVRVRAIDYTNRRLTLDRSLTWSAGAGVSLAFSGSRPDIGSFESGQGGTTAPPPAPPTNLRIIR